MSKIYQTFSEHRKLASEIIDYLHSVPDVKMLTTVKLARLLCDDEAKRQKIAHLVSYIENNLDGLYGSHSLRNRVEAKEMLLCNTRAIQGRCDIISVTGRPSGR